MLNRSKLISSLPRHIRYYLQTQEAKSPVSKQSGDAWLDLSQTNTLMPLIEEDSFELHAYPDTYCKDLRDEMAEVTKLLPAQILFGNGTTSLMDLLVRTFCDPHRDRILCFNPAANRIVDSARMHAVDVDYVSYEPDFQLPLVKTITRAIHSDTKILFLENPNRYAGQLLSNFDIADILSAFDGWVVVDESLIDYESENSMASFIDHCENLIVLRSFSGVYGLAACRLGVLFADEVLVDVLQQLQPVFSVNAMAQHYGIKALRLEDRKQRTIQKLIQQREQMNKSLQKYDFVKKIHPSSTSFLLVEVSEAQALHEFLRDEEHIHVQLIDPTQGMNECIRINLGTQVENLRLLRAFKEFGLRKSLSKRVFHVMSRSLKRASSFFGAFKKIFGI